MRKTSLVGFAPTFYFGFKAMENGSIEEGIRRIAKEAVTANGVEFVHAEIVGTKRNLTVRVYIDKPDGVTLEDCSAVSKRMEAVLDADDFIPSAYLLEVSSPGLERELYNLADFARFIGQRVKVIVFEDLQINHPRRQHAERNQDEETGHQDTIAESV